jgi:hypothetical protein
MYTVYASVFILHEFSLIPCKDSLNMALLSVALKSTTGEEMVMTSLDFLHWLNRTIVQNPFSMLGITLDYFRCTVGLCDTYESDRAALCILHGSGTQEVWYRIHVDILAALDSLCMSLQPSLDDTYKYVDTSRNFNSFTECILM